MDEGVLRPPLAVMKTVLKDLKTGLLFRNMDEWTSNLEEAAGFRDTLAALKFCQRNNLAGVAVVRAYANGAPERVVGFHRRRSVETEIAEAGLS
jgi:hypothetical protein